LNEYKKEAFALFDALLSRLRETVTQVLSHLEIRLPTQEADGRPNAGGGLTGDRPPGAIGGHAAPAIGGQASMASQHGEAAGGVATAERPGVAAATDDNPYGKVPRNAPCPCGSGKKFKQCHGRIG
jgi:preprotein translocase subunit SecA